MLPVQFAARRAETPFTYGTAARGRPGDQWDERTNDRLLVTWIADGTQGAVRVINDNAPDLRQVACEDWRPDGDAFEQLVRC